MRCADESATTALLLTLSGRLKPDAGRLKVLGHVLPARASAVRSHVAYVDAGEDGAEAVRRALAENPAVLVLDRTDRVSDPAARREIRALLTGSRRTVVAGTTGLAEVSDVLPATASPTVAELRGGAPAAPASSPARSARKPRYSL
ncbi:ABC transporter ATP-binding protein [Saccharopolyspora spinosporotrichia]